MAGEAGPRGARGCPEPVLLPCGRWGSRVSVLAPGVECVIRVTPGAADLPANSRRVRVGKGGHVVVRAGVVAHPTVFDDDEYLE